MDTSSKSIGSSLKEYLKSTYVDEAKKQAINTLNQSHSSVNKEDRRAVNECELKGNKIDIVDLVEDVRDVSKGKIKILIIKDLNKHKS